MKSYKITVLVFVFLAMFVSCEFIGNVENSTFTTISFTYRQLNTKSADSDISDDIQPNEIIYREIERQDAHLLRKPLADGSNSLMLPKGKNYLVGFVYNPNLDPDDTKDLPYIKVVGGLEVVNSNLSGTIPTTAETDSEIDLGDLSKGETGLETEVTLDDFSSMVGYSPEALTSFGVFDDSLLKYLNPDINRNGLYDVEEDGFDWILSPSRSYHLYADDFSLNRPTLSRDSFQTEFFTLVFWFTKNLPHVTKDQVYLTFPEEYEYIKRDSGGTIIVDGMFASHDVPLEANRYRQYYFSGINDYFSSPRPPYNGDYHLTLGSSQEYDIENIRLLSPWENSFEGFLFPQSKFEFNDEGYLQKINYTWWIIRDGDYQLATSEDMKLRIGADNCQFFYYLPPAKGWIQKPSTVAPSGELDVSRLEIHRSELNQIANSEMDAVRACYWDTAGNEWSFVNHLSMNRPK
jgi:hypothetical protein